MILLIGNMPKMSEESISLRQTKMAIVKHSTPKEGLICSKNMLSLSNSLASLPSLPNKLIQVSLSFEDNPDGWSSQYLKTICYGEQSNSSQIVFPRRLSTIIGSEESTEAFQKTSPFPMLPRKRSSNCSDAQSNEGLAGTTKTKSGQEAIIFKESVTKNKIKKIYKKRVCGKCFSPMLFFKNKFKGFYESYRCLLKT